MGSKYPILKPEEILKALNKLGFQIASQKGSHLKLNGGPVITTKIEGHKTDNRVFSDLEEVGWYWIESITLNKAYKVTQEGFNKLLNNN